MELKKEDRLQAVIDEILDKVSEGWHPEVVSKTKYIAEGRNVLLIEIELVDK